VHAADINRELEVEGLGLGRFQARKPMNEMFEAVESLPVHLRDGAW